jgi:hypothetical protein
VLDMEASPIAYSKIILRPLHCANNNLPFEPQILYLTWPLTRPFHIRPAGLSSARSSSARPGPARPKGKMGREMERSGPVTPF